MFTKLYNPNFMAEARPLLSADEATKAAFVKVFNKIISVMPGEGWPQTEEAILKSSLTSLGG